MARIDNLTNFLTDVADSIRSKTGKSETIAAEDFDTEIESIETGGGDTGEKTVLFYDYDGTLIASYTKEEFLELNTMPEGPSHAGLIFTSWNWTLEDAQEYVDLYGLLIIGALYRTDNGATRIHVDLKEGALTPTSRFYIIGDDTTIDWGDGTIDIVEGAVNRARRKMKHTYAEEGKYVIEIGGNSNTNIIFESLSISRVWCSLILTDDNTTNRIGNTKYQSAITNIELGDNVILEGYDLSSLVNLKTIIIPPNISISSNANGPFLFCYNLGVLIFPNILATTAITTSSFFEGIFGCQIISFPKDINGTNIRFSGNGSSPINLEKISLPNNSTYGLQLGHQNKIEKIIIPNNVNLLYESAFTDDYNLKEVVLSNAITSLPQRAFYNCYTLEKVIFGNALTTISNYAFASCYSLEKIEIPNTVTTISGSSGSGIFYGCSNLKQVKNFSNILAPYMFQNCYSLNTIEMDFSNITIIPSGCFYYCYSIVDIPFKDMPNLITIDTSAFQSCENLNLTKLPETVTKINNNAFYNCYSVNISTLPKNLITLGSNAFYFCDNKDLKTIPDGVATLPQGAFCANKFSQLSIPNVTSIAGATTTDCPFAMMTTLVALWIGSSITNTGLKRYSLYTGNVDKYKKIYIDLPRATVEAFTNYQYAFMNKASRRSVIICNDDEGWKTKEEFDTIDWENYTE